MRKNSAKLVLKLKLGEFWKFLEGYALSAGAYPEGSELHPKKLNRSESTTQFFLDGV